MFRLIAFRDKTIYQVRVEILVNEKSPVRGIANWRHIFLLN